MAAAQGPLRLGVRSHVASYGTASTAEVVGMETLELDAELGTSRRSGPRSRSGAVRALAVLLVVCAVGLVSMRAGSRAAADAPRVVATAAGHSVGEREIYGLLDQLHALLDKPKHAAKGAAPQPPSQLRRLPSAQSGGSGGDFHGGSAPGQVGCGTLDLGEEIEVHCASTMVGAVCQARCKDGQPGGVGDGGNDGLGEKYLCSSHGLWQKVYRPKELLVCDPVDAPFLSPHTEDDFTLMQGHTCNVDPHAEHLGAMGFDSPMTTTTDVAGCVQECLNNPACSEFEFQKTVVQFVDRTRCWLYRSFTEPKLIPAETLGDAEMTCGFITGARPCGGKGLPEGACDCAGELMDECGVCGGEGIPAGACNCGGNVTDVCGECGGDGIPEGHCDCAGNGIVSGECDCGGNRLDDCGVCGGPGAPQGACDCAGNVMDECGTCGGNATIPEGMCDCRGNGVPEGMCDCFGRTLDECGVCGGDGLPAGHCDCHGSVTDVCEVCGGDGVPEGKCDCASHVLDECGECGGGGVLDECGVCDGPGILLHVGQCDCSGSTLDECGVCGGPGIPVGHCDCFGATFFPGTCDCYNNTLDGCGVCGGPGVPEGHCDCHGSVLDPCGECGGDGFGPDNPEWKDTYGDGCERYRKAPEFCGYEDSITNCQTACRICPVIMAVHEHQMSSLNHANIHIGGNAPHQAGQYYKDHDSHECTEAQDPWGFRCEDYLKLGLTCENLIMFYGYDCKCSCLDERKAMAEEGTLPQRYPYNSPPPAPAPVEADASAEEGDGLEFGLAQYGAAAAKSPEVSGEFVGFGPPVTDDGPSTDGKAS